MEDAQTSYEKRGVDYQVPQGMVTLPREYFQSAAVYQEELEKIYYRRWLMVCREEEIPEPAHYLVAPVGDESIVLVRDDQGEIRAHFNVCRHRGTRICTAEQGRFDSGYIRCPYHAWQYDLSGHLNAAPMMKDVAGFSKADYTLFPAQVAVWGGFVFVNLAEDCVPFAEETGALIGKFEDWKLSELRIAHQIEYSIGCNWKLILQNYQECYHCPEVHPLLCKWTPFRSGCFDGAVIGGFMELSEQSSSLTMDGKAAAPPIGNVSGEDLQRVYYYSLFPNFLIALHPDYVLYHRIRPLDFDNIRIDCFFLLHPDLICDPQRMERFQSAIQFWDLTNRQDWQVCEQMQLGLKSQRFSRGRYAAQEDISHAIDKEVLKNLGHSPPV